MRETDFIHQCLSKLSMNIVEKQPARGLEISTSVETPVLPWYSALIRQPSGPLRKSLQKEYRSCSSSTSQTQLNYLSHTCSTALDNLSYNGQQKLLYHQIVNKPLTSQNRVQNKTSCQSHLNFPSLYSANPSNHKNETRKKYTSPGEQTISCIVGW